MKRKQFLALMLTVTLLAGSNMTAVTAMAASRAAELSGSALTREYMDPGVKAEDGDSDDESDSAALEQAITDAVGQVSTGAAKEETVYIFTDAYGKQRDITVSNWLKNPEKKNTLEDESDLQDIENVKGDETFRKDGSKLVWNANGNDIYYQGTTTRQPPVSEKITYYLDGKEIAAKDLAGKSGKVKIHIDYTNNMKYKDVYVPFAAVTGMAFSNDTVANVKIDNGSVVSEGKNTMVVGMAFPGLEDSLKTVRTESKDIVNKLDDEDKQKTLDRIDELDIPGSIEITMDATDFKMSTCLTMVFSNVFEMDEDDEKDFDEDHKDAFDEMDEKVGDLEKDGDELADGTQELVDGVQEAKDGTDTLYDGVKELADGIGDYTDGVDQVNEGAQTLADGTNTLTENDKDLKDGVKTLNEGAGTLADGAQTLADGTNTLAEKNAALNDGIGLLVAGTGTDGETTLGGGISALQTGLNVIADGISSYTSGVAAASEKLNGAKESVQTLSDGAAQLADEEKGVPAYVNGVNALADSLLLPGEGEEAGEGNITVSVGKLSAGAAGVKAGVDEIVGTVSQLSGSIEAAAKAAGKAASDAGTAAGHAGTAAEHAGDAASDAADFNRMRIQYF